MMQISACVITKNEEQNIGEWLTRMKSVAQECIVVDMGSTDNTVGLVKAAGASVYFFPWQGDFAAAKNFALEKATGDWIFFLDADEYFPAETLLLLEQSIHEAAGHLEQIQTAANGFLVSKSVSEAQHNAWQLMLPVGRVRQ